MAVRLHNPGYEHAAKLVGDGHVVLDDRDAWSEHQPSVMTAAPGPATHERTVAIPAGGAELTGILAVPPGARGIVVFAHGSGSGRLSPRNQAVAGELQRAGLATLLMDLLTPAEEVEDIRTARLRFDVALLGKRVVVAIDWLTSEPRVEELPVGCFGASTGAAAALIAAAARPERVRAVVSRGGRPDLAEQALRHVTAPTLLIVGGRDTEVIRLNRAAQALLGGPSRLEIVPGAGHLFEEPGALERVTELARDWFLTHLLDRQPPGQGGAKSPDAATHG